MNRKIQTRILQSRAEIEGFRHLWQQWPGHIYADIDFLLTRVEAHGSRSSPHVILALEGNEPKAMAVGCFTESELDFKISHKSLFRVPLRTVSVLRGGFLGDQSARVVSAVVEALQQLLRQGKADALVIGHTPVESPFYKHLDTKVSWFCRDHTMEPQPHWKMAVPDNLELVHARLTSHYRAHFRRKARNFEKQFPQGLAIKCFRDSAELDTMIRDVEEVSQDTYQRRFGGGFVDNPANRKRVALEAEKGWLRMYVLYVQSRPVAYWWGAVHGGIFYSEALGFDRALQRHSPGIYLINKAIENFCGNGVQTLDFGAGDYLYKRQFGDQCFQETQVFYVFAPRFRPVCLNGIRTLLGGLRSAARTLLKGFQSVRSRVKLRSKKPGLVDAAEAQPA
jgi:hypothetical protein